LVIVDEAAHATATETIVPLLYGKRALLIGDEMQLPPVVAHNVPECGAECLAVLRIALPEPAAFGGGVAAAVRMSGCWLECSLFEWLWRFRGELPRVMLDTQFRMHPDIAAFVGNVFYPEGLSTAITAAERTLTKRIGLSGHTAPKMLRHMFATTLQEGRVDPLIRNELMGHVAPGNRSASS